MQGNRQIYILFYILAVDYVRALYIRMFHLVSNIHQQYWRMCESGECSCAILTSEKGNLWFKA